jgi:hypothetical protein
MSFDYENAAFVAITTQGVLSDYCIIKGNQL